MVEELDAIERYIGILEHASNFTFNRRSFDQDADLLHSREVADNLRVDPWNRRELAGPVAGFMRPREPGGLVAFPFCG